MASTEDIHNTQKLANAAETFVRALDALFPGDTFDQFFHGETLRRAYWVALQGTLEQIDIAGDGCWRAACAVAGAGRSAHRP